MLSLCLKIQVKYYFYVQKSTQNDYVDVEKSNILNVMGCEGVDVFQQT